ncbi:PAS/PAC sensor signal transduction histidine kinase [Trichlorobacter thiogenes]|uniref:Phosphate regulon sensor protein PhoR n=1 Tax=Trichlorobacter thiogenes TaxID=115783 RepID=A0A1T4MEX0_9BACT|nr:phosphate regulon sensor histidine kinase PhoR [Trichlorobacter thiogenes]SJZ65579.1 PAS/PAC sensor signal transduction histidine kinase [Trichlorobacter thiogenes]
MSFRWKLFLSYISLSLLIAGGGFGYVNHLLEQRLLDESRLNLQQQAKLAKLLVEQQKELPPQKLAHKLGAAIKSRVTLIAADGRVLGESDLRDDQLSGIENHLMRPEVQQALKTGSGSAIRYSETVRATMLYVALPVASGQAAVLRLALPLESFDAAKENLHGLLGGTLIALLIISLILSVIFSKITARPLREIADAAARIGIGERGVRVPTGKGEEIDYLARVLNEMAARIEDQMHKLTSEQQRLAAILRGMGEGVMVTDTQGAIILVNPAFRKQFGLPGEVEGRPLVEVCRHPDLLQAFEEQRESGDEVTCEITIPATNLVLMAHWVPLSGEHGKRGTVAVFHDISDMKRIETMRRDFVANVSHELRTPVAVIKGYAETLLDGALEDVPERGRHFVSIIAGHAERLTSLINDILTLSKLEARDAALALHPLDLCGTIRKAQMLMEDHARTKGIRLTAACPESIPKVLADQGQLEQVLLNLLDNAIKYTPDGGDIAIRTRQENKRVVIEVSDTGIGIPPKDLKRIFERFYRVDEGRSREQGGTGLGLAIVKHIVQLHGGEIAVTSEAGKGSTFTVTLPAA